MPEATSAARLRIADLLRPHRGMLALGAVAVITESIVDLLEPWPLKIVFDYVFGSKAMNTASAISDHAPTS